MEVSRVESKIRSAFEGVTPDLKDRVMESCFQVEQLCEADTETAVSSERSKGIFKYIAALGLKRTVGVAAAAMLVVCFLVVGLFIRSGGAAESFVYIDVNPSVVIGLDADRNVVNCDAVNDDGETILSELELKGVGLNEALGLIISEMSKAGFITAEAGSVLVSVDTAESVDVDALISDISDTITHTLDDRGIEGNITCQKLKVNDELKQNAAENGISVGKMNYINKLIEEMGALSEEEADAWVERFKDEPIKELSKLHSEIKQNSNNGNNGNSGNNGNNNNHGNNGNQGNSNNNGNQGNSNNNGNQGNSNNNGNHENGDKSDNESDNGHSLSDKKLDEIIKKTEISSEDISDVEYEWSHSPLGFKVRFILKNGEVRCYFYSITDGEVTVFEE